MIKRKLDWRPSFKTDKHPRFDFSHDYQAELPRQVDLRPKCSPVLDQGSVGSCSGNAAASCFDFNTKELSSRLFIYWHERQLEDDTWMDAGATTLQDACITLMTKGVCRESVWPYITDQALVCPSTEAFAEATRHKIRSYYQLNYLEDMKQCLAAQYPFMFGVPVYEGFMQSTNGVIPMPELTERLLGGHALCCVGYDDELQMFIFKNSWSDQWGQDGYGYLPYGYMTNYGDDFFSIRR